MMMLMKMMMLMMVMMRKLDQVPTFLRLLTHSDAPINCDQSQSAVSRTSLSTACQTLRESVSCTSLSTECPNAEPFTRSPECLPCVESSNVLLGEVLTNGSGLPWME